MQCSSLLSTFSVFAISFYGYSIPFCANAETRFTIMDSSSGSWVARGYSDYTVTPADGWNFVPSRNGDNGVGLTLATSSLPAPLVDYWQIQFAAPFHAELVPGFYPDFQRWPFQDADRPGLSFSSSGRLDNSASGFFEILEATYGASGEVLTFAADFTHYGDGNPAKYAIVEIRYNTKVPEPSAIAILSLAIFFGAGMQQRSNHRRLSL